MLVSLKLKRAIARENEAELKQAVMTAQQYNLTENRPEYDEALLLLEVIELREKVVEARKQLQWALGHGDMRLLAVALRIMQDAAVADQRRTSRGSSQSSDSLEQGDNGGTGVGGGAPSPDKRSRASTEEDDRLRNRGWRVFSRFLADACELTSEKKLDSMFKALECAKSYGWGEPTLHEMVDKETRRRESLKKLEENLERFVKRALKAAVEEFDRDLLQKAIKDAENYQLKKLVEYDNAKTELLLFPQKQAIRFLQEAATLSSQQSGGGGGGGGVASMTAQQITQKLEFALRNLYMNDELKGSGIEHTPEAKKCMEQYRRQNQIPSHFDIKTVLNKLRSDAGEFIPAYRKPRDELKEVVQQLFDLTMIRKRTRDRRGMVPKALEAVSVVHVQNHKIWVNYLRGKNKIVRKLENLGAGAKHKLYNDPRRDPSAVKTMNVLKNGSRFDQFWGKLAGGEPPIDTNANEYYLFHGTKPEAALSITDHDFKINLAGTNAGTLYGLGREDRSIAREEERVVAFPIARKMRGGVLL